MGRKAFGLATAGLLLASGGAAWAEVTEAQPHGFQVRHTVEISAPPERVWAALIAPKGWWEPSHTFSGDAANLTLEARPGGCFCERWSGGGVQHLSVVHVRPNRHLGLWGGLGPLGFEGAAGGFVFTLKPAGAQTSLTLTYTVGGYVRSGMAQLAPAVDGMLDAQVRRLERLVETGRPDAPKQ